MQKKSNLSILFWHACQPKFEIEDHRIAFIVRDRPPINYKLTPQVYLIMFMLHTRRSSLKLTLDPK